MATSRKWLTIGDPLGDGGQGVVSLVRDEGVSSPEEVIADSLRRLGGCAPQKSNPL